MKFLTLATILLQLTSLPAFANESTINGFYVRTNMAGNSEIYSTSIKAPITATGATVTVDRHNGEVVGISVNATQSISTSGSFKEAIIDSYVNATPEHQQQILETLIHNGYDFGLE